MIYPKLGKKILLDHLNNWLVKEKYLFLDNGDGQIRLENDFWKGAILFNFFDKSEDHFNTTLYIHFKNVESIILNVGLPTIDLLNYRNGNKILFTIQDKSNINLLREKIKNIDLTIEKGYFEWASLIIHYMENEGAEFIHTYSHLPNVLKKLNALEDAGEKNYLKILLGGIDHLFRALIISRLCNDSRYQDKIERFDSIILQPKYEKWHPYYLKLKDELEDVEPIYGLEDT